MPRAWFLTYPTIRRRALDAATRAARRCDPSASILDAAKGAVKNILEILQIRAQVLVPKRNVSLGHCDHVVDRRQQATLRRRLDRHHDFPERSMKRFAVVICVTIAALAAMHETATAGIINGSFETGDLTGWSTSFYRQSWADVVVAPLEATHGDHFLRLHTGVPTTFVYLSQDFSANAGDMLLFDFRGYVDLNSDYYDISLWELPDLDQDPVHISFSDLFPSGVWQTEFFVLPVTGSYQLGFYLHKEWGEIAWLDIDNVRLEPVPEPAAQTLFVIGGLASMIAVATRRRRFLVRHINRSYSVCRERFVDSSGCESRLAKGRSSR